MNAKLVELLGERALANRDPQRLIDWAERSLLAGEDSPSLRVLAGLGLGSAPDSEEVSDYFVRALDELGVRAPTESEALHRYATLLVDRILAGDGDPRDIAFRLSKFYPATGYTDFLYSIWYYLDDDLVLMEDGHEAIWSGVPAGSIDDHIRAEARLWRALARLELPDDVFFRAICYACRHFGRPATRHRRRWLGRSYATNVCAECGSDRLVHCHTYDGRKALLEILSPPEDDRAV